MIILPKYWQLFGWVVIPTGFTDAVKLATVLYFSPVTSIPVMKSMSFANFANLRGKPVLCPQVVTSINRPVVRICILHHPLHTHKSPGKHTSSGNLITLILSRLHWGRRWRGAPTSYPRAGSKWLPHWRWWCRCSHNPWNKLWDKGTSLSLRLHLL